VTHSRRWPIAAGLIVSLAIIVQPAAAQAASGETRLALRPVDQSGDYFDLTLRPAEARTLEVDVANLGRTQLQVRTYTSDVYTIIDGGFGARLRDEPQTGATMWVDYATVVTELAAGETVRRAFSVRVPGDAAPGQYATSLIVENEVPTTGNGAIRVDQINRQAVAVLVTVPGPRMPGLAIGAATHKVFDGRSIVSIAVRNTGNVRLKPVVGFTLFDSTGHEIRRGDLAMDTFYARTDTLVEFPFDFTLPPGVYTVDLTLDDAAQHASATMRGIPLTVAAEARPTSVGTAAGQGGPSQQGVIPFVIGLALLVGVVLGIIACLLVLAIARRRPRKDPDR